MVLSAPVLSEEQHATADKTPVAGKQERGKLGAQAHSTDALFTQRGNHHGIHHAAGGGQKILKSDGNGDCGNHGNQLPERCFG